MATSQAETARSLTPIDLRRTIHAEPVLAVSGSETDALRQAAASSPATRQLLTGAAPRAVHAVALPGAVSSVEAESGASAGNALRMTCAAIRTALIIMQHMELIQASVTMKTLVANVTSARRLDLTALGRFIAVQRRLRISALATATAEKNVVIAKNAEMTAPVNSTSLPAYIVRPYTIKNAPAEKLFLLDAAISGQSLGEHPLFRNATRSRSCLLAMRYVKNLKTIVAAQ